MYEGGIGVLGAVVIGKYDEYDLRCDNDSNSLMLYDIELNRTGKALFKKPVNTRSQYPVFFLDLEKGLFDFSYSFKTKRKTMMYDRSKIALEVLLPIMPMGKPLNKDLVERISQMEIQPSKKNPILIMGTEVGRFESHYSDNYDSNMPSKEYYDVELNFTGMLFFQTCRKDYEYLILDLEDGSFVLSCKEDKDYAYGKECAAPGIDFEPTYIKANMTTTHLTVLLGLNPT